ncbi:hypothetical protein PV10_02008 [Exophiala mesophila]|uniref:Uncharacterized protein n=1 Tax=Exophiala mesophila TaxID=212818 RepID=A0A0D1WXQ9_EXOME|nr:uncharacterized protein PV10_02008 [Exophiala mesophila]KIV94220.1 hypothetical protein PV10_02008 [Exophiala mesophila]
MPSSTLLLWFLYVLAVTASVVLPRSDPCNRRQTKEIDDANHLFNAIHSSMRQWGSSVNHNGMSLFLAQVPAGTQFYHGTHTSTPVQGMEWLAFEPEHARNFAVKFPKKNRRPPPRSQTYAAGPRAAVDKGIQYSITKDGMAGEDSPERPGLLEAIFGSPKAPRLRPAPSPMKPGWLHTYKTKALTPLLYIDGMSAGKTSKGTLDVQDILLLNRTDADDDRFWEYERASGLCKLSKERWGGKIKGFIRMEAGFEIIMCSFDQSLDFQTATRAGSALSKDYTPSRSIWNWIHAVASRYDGIGGHRVTLDYNNFVTAFSHDMDLFLPDAHLPRLTSTSDQDLNTLRCELDKVVNDWDSTEDLSAGQFTDWQSVADMIVARYATELKYLTSGRIVDRTHFLKELDRLLANFIDSDARDFDAEVARCVAQNMPGGQVKPSSIAGRALSLVSTRICSTLLRAFSTRVDVAQAVADIQSLITYLDWTIWKRCDQCELGRICFTPVWPFGSTQDYEHPQCRNESELQSSYGYWDERGAMPAM